MTYDTAAIMKDAHGRAGRQWKRQGFPTYASAFAFYLSEAWHSAKCARRTAEAEASNAFVLVPYGSMTYLQYRTDGAIRHVLI